jgi:hypothetical protein
MKRERRQKATDKARAALDTAKEEHTQRVASLPAQMEAIETKLTPLLPTGRKRRDN